MTPWVGLASGNLGRHRPPSPFRVWRRLASVFAEEADEAALDLDAIGREDAGFVGGVGGFEGDGVALAAEALEGGFFVIDEGHDDLAGRGGDLLFDDDGVAIENAGVDHGIAAHFERVVFAGAEHFGGNGNGVGVGLDRLDGGTGSDAAHDRDRDGAGVIIVAAGGGRSHLAQRAFNDRGLKAGLFAAERGVHRIGKL